MVEGRRFAKEFAKHFFDVGQHGICHVILAENGLAPGELLVCADSTRVPGKGNCAAVVLAS